MILENGQRYEGDMLVGADGIWSKVVLCSEFTWLKCVILKYAMD